MRTFKPPKRELVDMLVVKLNGFDRRKKYHPPLLNPVNERKMSRLRKSKCWYMNDKENRKSGEQRFTFSYLSWSPRVSSNYRYMRHGVMYPGDYVYSLVFPKDEMEE